MFLKESISPSKSFNGLSSDGRQPRIPTPVPPYTKDELRQAAISKHQLENNLDQTSAAKNSLNSLEGVLTITLCQSQLQQRFPASSADQTNIVLNTQNLLQIRFETRNYQLFSSWRPVERDHKQCFIDWHREAIHIPVQVSFFSSLFTYLSKWFLRFLATLGILTMKSDVLYIFGHLRHPIKLV